MLRTATPRYTSHAAAHTYVTWPYCTRIQRRLYLHLLCHSQNEGMVQLLADNGAEVSRQNAHGESPIHVAMRANAARVVTALLELGVDARVTDEVRPLRVHARVLHVLDRTEFVLSFALLWLPRPAQPLCTSLPPTTTSRRCGC